MDLFGFRKNRLSLSEFLAPFEILDFDTDKAEKFGILQSQLKRSGKRIGPYDMLIASGAVKGLGPDDEQSA